jgi:hypothetical protein
MYRGMYRGRMLFLHRTRVLPRQWRLSGMHIARSCEPRLCLAQQCTRAIEAVPAEMDVRLWIAVACTRPPCFLHEHRSISLLYASLRIAL